MLSTLSFIFFLRVQVVSGFAGISAISVGSTPPRGSRSSSLLHSLGKASTAEDVAALYGKDLAGKVAVVTGGNSGIGLETVRVLAKSGCKVILCSRAEANGAEALTALQNDAAGVDLDVLVQVLDLADLANVERAAQSIKERLASLGKDRIDYLVLNAGVMAMPQLQRTAQGFEKQIGVNHFGHFHLTSCLGPLVAQEGCRVVVLSSTAHNFGEVDLDDLNYAKGGRAYSPWGAYGQSKACNLLFAKVRPWATQLAGED